MTLIERLSQNHFLWKTFIGTVLLTFAFPIVSEPWGITLIDAISDPTETRQVIASMSEHQRTTHAWITATLDVVYPLVYGALFIGSAHKFYGKIGWALAAPIFVLIATDLMEGVVQVLALTSVADLVDAKAVLTPLKFALVFYGLAMTAFGWLLWLYRRVRKVD